MAEPIGNDATGYDVLTAAMKSLLNQFTGLYPDEVIKFEELGSEDGIAFSNDSGALVYTEKEASSLEEMNVGQLQKLARASGLEPPKNAKKQELISALRGE